VSESVNQQDINRSFRLRLAALIDAGVGEGLWNPVDVADTVIAGLGLRVDRVGVLSRWVSEWVDGIASTDLTINKHNTSHTSHTSHKGYVTQTAIYCRRCGMPHHNDLEQGQCLRDHPTGEQL